MVKFRKHKRQELREVCREMYGDDFVFKYDLLCSGVPIGTMEETISFLKDIDAAQKVSNKTRRRLKKDKLLYDEGFHDGKRDAMKWISVKERLPDEDGEYLIGWANSDEMYLSCFTRDCFGMSFGLRDKEQEHRPAWYYIDDEWGEVEWDNVEYWMEKPAPPETKGEENE